MPDHPDEQDPFTPEQHAERRERLDTITAQLRSLKASAEFEHAMALGDQALARFFDDDPELFERTHRENQAWRRRVGRWRHEMDFLFQPIGRTRYQHLVRVVAQYRRFPADVQQGLSLAHHRYLLRLPDISDRIELARTAMAAGWSPEELAAQIPWDEERARLARRERRLAIRLRTVARRLAPNGWETLDEYRDRLAEGWEVIHHLVAVRGRERLNAQKQAWEASRPQR